jgi:hypothetical protein
LFIDFFGDDIIDADGDFLEIKSNDCYMWINIKDIIEITNSDVQQWTPIVKGQ